MSDMEIRMLAKYIVAEASQDEALLDKVISAVHRVRKKEKKLITAKEAAMKLGISVWSLYRLKSYPSGEPVFSCVKTGNTKSSTLRYNANTVVEEYDRYLAFKRGCATV